MRLRDRIKLLNVPINKIKTDEVPTDKELQTSLLEQQQKYPVKIRPIIHPDFDYEIVNGRQRIKALVDIGEIQVLALIEEMDDVELHFQALIGNANRPNEIDEARHIIELEQRGFTGQEIAKMIRFSQATVSQRKRLIEKLHPNGQAKLQAGEIKVSTALEATKLPLSEQEELFKNGDRPSYKDVFEKVRTWESSQLEFDLEVKTVTKPGLFLTSEQVESLLAGQTIIVEWMEKSFNIKGENNH